MTEIRDKEQAISRLQEIGRNMQAYCDDMKKTKFGCRSCIFHDFVCDLGNAGLKIRKESGARSKADAQYNSTRRDNRKRPCNEAQGDRRRGCKTPYAYGTYGKRQPGYRL